MATTQKLDLRKFVPSELQNELSNSLLSNLFNRFLSEEQSVFISGQVGKTVNPADPVIQASDLDHALNALVPALYFQTGTEKSIITFEDMLNKMQSLGVDGQGLQASLAEQSLNLAPPINFDKFVNYTNYYWFFDGAAPSGVPAWNTTGLPEFYVIERPSITGTIKMPVALATTRPIALYGKDRAPEMVTITFTDASNFTITGSNGPLNLGSPATLTGHATSFEVYAAPGAFGTNNPADSALGDPLFSFTIRTGVTAFQPGDSFTIDITYITGSNTVSFMPGSGSTAAGKGFISNVVPDTSYMFIDGVQVKPGQSVLVKDQQNPAENGVYNVMPGKWTRALSWSTAQNFPLGTRVFVVNGATNGQKMFASTTTINTLGTDPLSFALVAGVNTPDVNDWQAFNFWIHKDDIQSFGLSLSSGVQATRPIVEYSVDLQLNEIVNAAGLPDSTGTSVPQRKTRFNQIPQFDLFYYDGTHSNKTSGIFFYQEDPTVAVDPVLQRRAATTVNSDFIFGLGITDPENRLLFFKRGGKLTSIWAPGVTAPEASTITFTGNAQAQKGSVVLGSISPTADNQDWTLTAISSTQFTVFGSRAGVVGTATVGQQFSTTDLELTITAGATPFSVGDAFDFTVRNKLAPRYVQQNVDGSVTDAAPSGGAGTWLTPRRMFENMLRALSTTINYGDMIDHLRSIIKDQNGFTGASFGVNNYRSLSHNLGYGGTIHEFSSNFPLLAGLLAQRDVSPSSIIDFAEQQYISALASVDQYIADNLPSLIGSTVPTLAAINPADPVVQQILASFIAARAANVQLQEVFSDTSSKIANWPITLPMFGAVPAVAPRVDFDFDLGLDVIVHHDGHVSPVASDDIAFAKTLVAVNVLRSDGTTSSGIFTDATPLTPYKGQLWLKTSTQQLFVFNVASDATTPPATGSAGQFWYNRAANQLRSWDEQAGTWVLSTTPIASLWVPFSIATVRNSLVLAVEQQLFASVHPALTQKVDLSVYFSDPLAQIELARFAAKYGYDTYAPIYDATDAFTWNYTQAFGHARWFDVYKAYFSGAGMISTSRPDLEPWKLLGYATEAAANTGLGIDWQTKYGATTPGRSWTTQMWQDIIAARPGIKVCVNINTDALLPPYVSSALPESAYALTTTMPAGISDPYVFGDDGPVENVWTKSIEYRYGMMRVYFKRKPLDFVDRLWGETYMYSDPSQIKLERNLLQPNAPSKFLLHGERLNIINQRNAQDHISGSIVDSDSTATVTFTVTHVEDNATFFYAYINGVLQGMVQEGVPFNMTSGGITFSNVVIDDKGIPFSFGDTFTIQFTATPDPATTPAPTIAPEDCGCVIPGSSNTLPFSSITVTSVWTFTPSQVKNFLGLGQLFTNLLRFNFVDTELSYVSNAYRGWDIRLVHRLGALIRDDSLTIDTAQGILPDTAFNVVIKRSEKVSDQWISAIRVQLVQAGKRVMNPANGNYIPYADGSDWVFRIETFNPDNPVIDYYGLDTNGDFETFFALAQQSTSLPWKHFTTQTGVLTSTTPFLVTGIQNVLNFLFGYVARLTDLGFKINMGNDVITDAETGRNLDWQLEIEKFINVVYTGLTPGDGYILNPFSQALWFDTPYGLLSRYAAVKFIDITSVQATYDVNGSLIPLSALFVVRSDDGAMTYSDTPMFSAHLFTDTFEHTIVFNSNVSTETGAAILFDQFLGARIDYAYLSYTRQAQIDGKPNFNGFMLSGDSVKRNITSSVDGISGYYDSYKTFAEPLTTPHALALLGFDSKQYFSNIGISETTQFNFWRGLIQAKGTNMSINAFVNYKKFLDASVDEYWAYKIAQYGDSRKRNQPEMRIEQTDCQQHFTSIQFYDATDTAYLALPGFIQVERQDDTRWFSPDDVGASMSFIAQPISYSETLAPGYYKLPYIFHNGDRGAPQVLKDGLPTNDAVMVNASLLKVIVGGYFTVNGITWENKTKYSPVKLFNYQANTLVQDITLWHPAIGIHAYEPLELINIIAGTDPASYNYSTQQTNNPNYSTLKPWGKKEVGRVWWDTSNLGYVPYYDASIFPARNERNARWGSLAEWASIDLYEWVESTVPPSQWDALAATQAGQYDVDASIRASGTAAFKTYYSRNRTVTMSPVAWSHAAVGAAAAHPSFGPALTTKVYIAGGAIFPDTGRAADVGLSAGRSFGGWSAISNVPVGEAVLTATLSYDIGSTSALSNPLISGLTISPIESGRLGARIGIINLTTRTESDGSVYLRMSDDFGYFQELQIPAYLGNTTDVRVTNFTDFGISIQAAGALDAATYCSTLVSGWYDVVVREGIGYTQLLPLPDTVLVNDPSDPDWNTHDYGWKAWDIPAQSDLSSDLAYPLNTWLPYVGSPVTVTMTPALAQAMSAAPLVLSNGSTVSRFSTSWSDWAALTPVKLTAISNGSQPVQFVRAQFLSSTDILDTNRVSIYVNGIQASPQSFTFGGTTGAETVTLNSVIPEGQEVVFVYREYQPTAAELAFDPSVSDNPSIQTQYKADYQYTKVDVRDSTGVVSSSLYYFWVKDTTVAKPNQSMSLSQATSILKSGQDQYMIFARYNVDQNFFDSCVVVGLDSLVTDNNTYKLRFMNNFTLLDDPEQMSLKNVHTEWTLIKRSQAAKIPAQLWNLLTDAAAGEDIGGNPLPSQIRIDYDNRHGTSYRFGFGPGQIFADTQLVRSSIVNTVLNTSLTVRVGDQVIPDYITALNFSDSDNWFKDAGTARATMDLIWNTARPKQINEIFFEVLEDALANNYQFSDIFKTSLISVSSATIVSEQAPSEISSGIF